MPSRLPAAAMRALREGAWLTSDRALAWARMLALFSLACAVVLVLFTAGGGRPDPSGRPLGTDFSSFWTAARMALAGDPASAWDAARHMAAERRQFSPAEGFRPDFYAFFYPPPFLLICLPLGLLSYGQAAAAWIAVTALLYFAVMRRLLPKGWNAPLVALSFPALALNAGHGQNGALSAALLGAAGLALDRRPWIAGCCLGALCYKPQAALFILPALLAARRWRALAGAALASGAFCLGSWILLGEDSWRAFSDAAPLARQMLVQGLNGFGKMVSSFAAGRLLGLGLPGSWAVQFAVSAAATTILVRRAVGRPGGKAEAACLAAVTCAATPFLLDYDLMLLAIPLAWMASEAEQGGYLPWEKTIGAAAFILPLASRPLALGFGIPVSPLVTVALLWVVGRRIRIGARNRPGADDRQA